MTDKKFYWLKLKKDFFKRHDMTIIEGMPNGKDYLLFYLKLLVESLDHSGSLRFSETIPYSVEMLSSLTHTNIDVVRSALKVFTELQLVEILDDETIFMTEVEKMTGCETVWAEKKREYRLNKKDNVLQNEDNVRTEKDNVRQEIRDKSIDNNIYVSPEVDTKDLEEEINKNFEIIYNLYPKKNGVKAAAKRSYKKWIQKSGRKVAGKTYHLTNKQIWEAVKNYVSIQEKSNTELQYYKNFDTLMNNIVDYIPEDLM